MLGLRPAHADGDFSKAVTRLTEVQLSAA